MPNRDRAGWAGMTFGNTETAMQHARWVLRLEQHFGPTVERLNVIDDGLATRLGDRVGVTQAAVRFGAVGSATR